MNKQILILATVLFTSYTFCQGKKDKDINKNHGFFNITRFGVIPNFDIRRETFDSTNGKVITKISNNSIAFSIQTINGYFINENLSVGLGIGLDRYNNPSANTIPAFLDARYYFKESAKSIYFLTNIGSLIKIENGTRKGSMVNVGLGAKFPLRENSRTFLVSDLSFSHKSISFDGLPIRNSRNFTRINGVMITVGIIF